VGAYRFVPHTADVAVELSGRDESELRAAGVDALRHLLVGDSIVEERERRAVPLRGTDATTRLVHFLQDVLYLFATEQFVPARLTDAGVSGEPLDATRHESRPEVKAVTFHGADASRTADGRMGTLIVFDV
jgi:SHS2 domain-containing protein